MVAKIFHLCIDFPGNGIILRQLNFPLFFRYFHIQKPIYFFIFQIMTTQKSKFFQWIDYRVRITLTDQRMLVGTFLAFDKHLNVILSECEEFRIRKKGKDEVETKRTVGMIVIRGDNIVSLSAEAPPHQPAKKIDQLQPGPGKAQPITRAGQAPITGIGQGTPNVGLTQVQRGVGAPQQYLMVPPGMQLPPQQQQRPGPQ